MLTQSGIQTSESIHLIRFRFALVYTLSLGIFFVPFAPSLAWLTLLTFALRVFGWEAGAHRYFAHRSFKTSRAFQFILACLSASSGQRGPIWWAVHHREHHRHSDTPRDPHSPVTSSRAYAYAGWFLVAKNADTNLDAAREWARYPELVWINKYHYLLPYVVLVAVFVVGQYTTVLGPGVDGISAAIWGFFFSTFLSYQGALLVNAFAHGVKPLIFSYRTFETSETSANNWLLALLSMGASWHNNHHRYMSAARAGFYWWEIDLTYWMLRVLAVFGIVWDVREVPRSILGEGRARRDLKRDAAG